MATIHHPQQQQMQQQMQMQMQMQMHHHAPAVMVAGSRTEDTYEFLAIPSHQVCTIASIHSSAVASDTDDGDNGRSDHDATDNSDLDEEDHRGRRGGTAGGRPLKPSPAYAIGQFFVQQRQPQRQPQDVRDGRRSQSSSVHRRHAEPAHGGQPTYQIAAVTAHGMVPQTLLGEPRRVSGGSGPSKAVQQAFEFEMVGERGRRHRSVSRSRPSASASASRPVHPE
ncbi:hypothetical protein BC831DRAFT_454242 [Entophlyctis helioformis]|nr:hypothetical protein BC831DRAFT_454242 [Entophlyctis helioformis]